MTARSSDTINVFDTRGKGRSAVDFGVMTTNEDILAEFGEDDAVISANVCAFCRSEPARVFFGRAWIYCDGPA